MLTITHSDKLTAIELLKEFKKLATIDNMEKQEYSDCLKLLTNAIQNKEFTVKNEDDRYLITSILGYKPRITQ